MRWSLLFFFLVLVLGASQGFSSNQWSPYSKSVQTQDVEAIADNEDKEAFFTLLNMLLWDQPESNDEGRQYFRRQGLLGRPMPVMLREPNSLGGSMYRNFADRCYGILCTLGLKGLARSLLQLTL